jgi:hypothetical protein
MCKKELVMDATETDDPAVIGEECHIVAQKPDGPRGDSPLTPEQRDKYNNLIVLCNVDHKIIDDQPSHYTVDHLMAKKKEHELWVKETLGFDSQKQHDSEVVAGYVEEWAERVKLDQWNVLISWLLSAGQPSLRVDMVNALEDVRPWLLSRIWPDGYVELRDAFLNFRLVTQDLCDVFMRHAAELPYGKWQTEKFYKIREWDEERYRALAKQFHAHVALVEDLALELTRAANYICDEVRSTLMRSYRINEGALLIEGGPFMDFSFKTYRVEYRGKERVRLPYPGLAVFQSSTRFTRDVFFGHPEENANHGDKS